MEKELERLRRQVEVQNDHLTVSKQACEQLRADLLQSRQAISEVSQTDLAKKIFLL